MTTQTTRPTIAEATPSVIPSAGSQTAEPTIPGATPKRDSSARSAFPAPAIAHATPYHASPGRGQTASQPNYSAASKLPTAAGPEAGRDHTTNGAQAIAVPAVDLPGDHLAHGTQRLVIAGVEGQPAAKIPATPVLDPPLADPFLALAADVVDDLEKVRIANENRLRQLTRDATDKDGEERGFGLTLDHPDVARLAALVEMLGEAEHKAVLNLGRLLRKHPLGPWIRAQVGLGEKQAARLLAAIGDPYWNDLHGRPRTVSELWAYAGYHVIQTPVRQTLSDTHGRLADGTDFPADHFDRDTHVRPVGGEQTGHPDHFMIDTHGGRVGVAAKRARGQKANWSATAKMRAYLIAESCIKQRSSPYRKTYDDTRQKYTDAVHKVPCVRCGPAGKPAAIASPLSDGHKHARALRAVAKAVLKDLWREAKRIHEEATHV